MGVVGETAMTPLYAKAKAAEVLPAAGLSDPLAAELLAAIGHDPDRVLRDRTNLHGTIYRTLAIDRVSVEFATRHPHGQLVSVGIGLCTRHSRLADRVPATVDWIGVDTAEVIAVRRRYLRDDPVRLVTGSIAVSSWTRDLDPDRATLVIAEGVLMYLDGDEVLRFLGAVRDRFGPGTEVVADIFHPRIALSGRHPIVKATGAQFRSGARNGAAFAALVSGYRLLVEYPVMERIGLPARFAARAFRLLTRGGRAYVIARVQVSG